MDDIEKLKKTVKEQQKQIDSLKKAIAGLQQTLMVVSKKVNRTYETGRRNANDINNVTRMIRRNGQ
jgi:cell division septum initiation protein DivIVA